MKVVAYSGLDWQEPSRWVAKTKPFTSPPHGLEAHSDSIGDVLQKASESDLFYIRLHGYEGIPNYFGQDEGVHFPKALSPEIVSRFSWRDVVVFAEVCFSACERPENQRMIKAFFDGGARAFIGSVSTVYGRTRPVIFDGEGDLLARHFISVYRKERDHRVAWALALGMFALSSIPLDAEDRATIRDFRILEAV